MIPFVARRSPVYIGTGGTATYAFTFKVFSAADVAVLRTNTAGVESTLVLNTDYSVLLNADQDNFPGGSITLLAGNLPAAYNLVILGDQDYSQTTQLPTGGAYNAKIVEAALDRVSVMAQQLNETLGRTLQFASTDTVLQKLPGAAQRARTAIVFDDAGNVSLSPDLYSLSSALAHADADAAQTAADRVQTGLDVATTTTQAAAATTQAGLAATAKTAAETARDAAFASAKAFGTTAQGLAATTTGQTFLLRTANLYVYDEYWNNAGVATLLGQLNLASGTALSATAVPNARYAVQDVNDNAAMLVDDTGYYFAALDADTFNGVPRAEIKRVARRSANLTASYVAHISYGQSLSVGANAGIHTRSDIDSGFFDSVMFNANGVATAGPRAQDGTGTVAQNHASFIPYTEQFNASSLGETPLGNALRMVKRLLRDEDGILPAAYDYILVGSAPGQSNITISGLSKGGGIYYQRVIDDVTYGLALAQAAGKSYAVDAIYWSQGEADATAGTARATYTTALQTLYTNLNTDIKALTGQPNDIKLIGYQMSWGAQPNNTIALAQLDAAKANSSIILATSSYAFMHIAPTDAHLTGFGSASLGAYYGLAAKRVIVDKLPWVNLYPARLTRQGTILEIEFPDTGYPLAIDNALFPTQTNAGFTALRADNVTDNPVVSVAVVGPKRVRIVLTNAEAGKLRYGFASWGGNLHDTCDIDPGTANAAFTYRPCLTFEEPYA